MKKFISALLLTNLIGATFAYASEPINIAIVKQALKRYHDVGEYDQEIEQVELQALDYLKARLSTASNEKPAIVLDIDETSLSNYPSMLKLDFGGTMQQIRNDEDLGKDEVIKPTLALYRYAKAHHVAVFFITGRFEEERKTTIKNLRQAGYKNWDGLIMRSGKYRTVKAAVYKTAMRKALVTKGYDIILSMGDQYSDLKGEYADKTFKLPNPFYYIP